MSPINSISEKEVITFGSHSLKKKGGKNHHGSLAEAVKRSLLEAAAARRRQPAEGNGTAHKVPSQFITTQLYLKIPSNCSPGLRES